MEILCSLLVIVISILFIKSGYVLWVKPTRIRTILSKQGIRGPKSAFLYGNLKEIQKIQSTVKVKSPPPSSEAESASPSASASASVSVSPASLHNWVDSIFPYLQKWTLDYGGIYMFSTGTQQHLYVNKPQFIKELKTHKSLDLGTPKYLSKALEPMIGNGIIKANGHQWAVQRKVIAPELFIHKVKGMVGLMEESAMEMIRKWERQLTESEGGILDLIIDQDLRSLSADIISRACFGSSYSQGKNIFAKLRAMQEAMSKPGLLFGFIDFRFLPTKSNREIWRLKKEVEDLILKVVKGRQAQRSQKDSKISEDLLQILIESAASDRELRQHIHNTDRFIVDNCKNIYFAGYESTALTVSWTLMLLAIHPEWQQRVRSEATEICCPASSSHQNPSLDLDKLTQLKMLNMVIQESLRLYSPSVVMSREAFADIKLGDFLVPKGLHIWSLIPVLHRDPENWGPEANDFKPQRFANGISEACKYPQNYIPFGFGTRLCVGQTFALLEMKIVLSLLVSRFSFSVSPKYIHSPVFKMLLTPEHGMRLIVKEI